MNMKYLRRSLFVVGWCLLSIVLLSCAAGVLQSPPAWRFATAIGLIWIAGACTDRSGKAVWRD